MEEKNAGNIILIIAAGLLKLLWVVAKAVFVVALVFLMAIVEAAKPKRSNY